jgi:hypothetical protein
MNLTPTSALVWIDVNSMAGSGLAVFADFGEAIEWLWERLYGDTLGPDEQMSTEEREGRGQFQALLARFKSDGYARDMGGELADIVSNSQSDKKGIPAYAVGSVEVLPDDLDSVLDDWWGDPDADDYFASLTDQGKPMPEFDFANAEHMALLERRVEEMMQW